MSGVREAYNSWASTYDTDRNSTRDLDAQITRRTLAGSHYSSILELGCGTGKNTAFLAAIGGHVTALDFSEEMLRQAHTKLALPSITFLVADLTQMWPCPAASFDLVVCNLVLEHIEDMAFIFSEAARCLKPHGLFFVSELHPFKQYLGSKAGGRQDLEIPVFTHNISDYFDAAWSSGFTLSSLREWWDTEPDAPPRLVSFMFVSS